MKRHTLRGLTGLALAALLIGLIGCRGGGQTGAVVSEDPVEIARARGLSPADVVAAVKTYQPTGTYDEYIMFASGGHSGQVLVIGIPSMRLLKVIGVFTPEPWQGWGFSKETREVLAQGNYDGKELTWGDVHHPALSETNGDYDGQFLFVNEKANARVAVIDLRDFETKQIVKNPLSLSDHGGTFVTPNTEWVIEGGQYAAPFEGYASLDQYKEEVSRAGHLLEVRPRAGADPSRAVLRAGAAALLAGPVRRRQAGERRVGLLQLVQHGNGHGWRGERQPALRGRRLAARHGLPARDQPAQGG